MLWIGLVSVAGALALNLVVIAVCDVAHRERRETAAPPCWRGARLDKLPLA
jgi:hypothetical protein